MSKIMLFRSAIPIILLFLSFSFTMTAQGTEAMIDQALREMVDGGELTSADIDEYRMTDHYVSKGNGVDHMYFCQTYNGIDIHNAVGSMHVLSNGKVLTKNVGFSKDFESRITGSQSPVLTVLQAVTQAAKAKGYIITENLQILSQENGPDQFARISKGGVSLENITAKLKYLDTGKTVRLTWEVSIYEIGGQNWFNLRVDANNGELLDEDNMVDTCFDNAHDHKNHDHAMHGSTETLPANDEGSKRFNPLEDPLAIFAPDSYNVYALPASSPHDDGGVIRTNEVNPANAASPFGWHDTDGMAGAEYTITRGNNTHAYADRDGNNIPDVGSDPDGGMALDFNFPIDLGMAPLTYQPASVTNLFYWTNIMHDVLYLYGFDELSGNFQENNYSNGGLGGDPIFSEAQDGANGFANCNANFATPPDGMSGRNQMYTCDISTPDRDGSLDNEVITHEIGHGVSNRLTGGPMNTSCLDNNEQMGEGWSDFFSVILTLRTGDTGPQPKTVGTWLLGTDENGPGVRNYPYSTDMMVNPQTYNSIIGTGTSPHDLGEVWNTMLWEMTWGLIDVYGLNPNIYDDWTTGGNNLALQLVMDGMKLQPCSPGFVDGRDAILAADIALTGGVNQCIIWEAFAKRGLGFSADQGSTDNRDDGIEAFDVPPCIPVDPITQDICLPDDAVYAITTPASMGNWTLSALGAPAGTNVGFGTNPIGGGAMTTMTISNTVAATIGMYTITITADDGMTTYTTSVDLFISNVEPNPQFLISPVDMSTGLLQPYLVWDDTNGANSWMIEVDDDPGFGSPEVSETIMNSSYPFTGATVNTLYYWRVTGINGCGMVMSPVWSFDTNNSESCDTWASSDVPILISDGPAGFTYTSTLNIPDEGIVSDMNVTNLNITHTWIGDLNVTLISPSGTEVDLVFDACDFFPRFENMDINFDDESPNPYGAIPCPPTDGLTYQPLESLSAFDGECITGTWTLSILDDGPMDGGQLTSWSLDGCYISAQTCYADTDNDGYGDPATEMTVCGSCALGQVTNNLDCDDMDPAIFPGQNCEIAPIPTMGEWGIIILSFLLMIIGIASVRQRKTILS